MDKEAAPLPRRYGDLEDAWEEYKSCLDSYDSEKSRLDMMEDELRHLRSHVQGQRNKLVEAHKALKNKLNEHPAVPQIHIDDDCQIRGVMES